MVRKGGTRAELKRALERSIYEQQQQLLGACALQLQYRPRARAVISKAEGAHYKSFRPN